MMFREMRRFKQALSGEECVRVLWEEPRGVLAVHGEDGYPYAFPMNHLYLDGKLYFHCAKEGHKLDALAEDPRVSFCVMDKGFRREGEWALNIRSVVVFGRVRKLDDPAEMIDVLRQLGRKNYPRAEDVEEELRKAAQRAQVLEMTIDHMTGKLVNES